MITQLLAEPSSMINFNEKGHMTFDSYDLVELSQKYPTPFYVFSGKKIENQYQKIKKVFNEHFQTNVNISFPVRVNPNKAILKVLHKNDSYFTASSLNELALLAHIIDIGKHSASITYHSPILTKKEIKLAMKRGVKRFIVDNEIQIERLNAVAKQMNVKLQVWIDLNTGVKPKNSELPVSGLDIYYALSFFEKTNDSPNLELRGIYNSLDDQNTDIKAWIKNIKQIAEFTLRLLDAGVEIKNINLGQGIPIPFTSKVPMSEIAEALSPYILELKKDLPNLTITLEPGLFISAPSGVLLTKIRNIKDNNLYVNASIFNTSLHTKISNLNKPYILSAYNSEEPEKKYHIRGNQNSPHDIFDRDVMLPPQKMHDLLIFFNAGSYLYSTDFAQVKKIKTLLIKK